MATLAGLAWSRGAAAGRCLTTRCACRCRATTTGSASIQQPCPPSKWRDPTGGSHHGSRFASPCQTPSGRLSMVPLERALLFWTGAVGPTAWVARDGNSTWKGRGVLRRACQRRGRKRRGGAFLSVSLGLPEKPSGIRFSRICLLQRGESLGYPQTICGEFETVDRKAPVLLLPIGMQDLGFRWPLLSWM